MADNALSPEAGLSINDPVAALDLSIPPLGEFRKALGRGARRGVAATAAAAEAPARAAGLDTIAGWLDEKADEFEQAAKAPNLAANVADATQAVESLSNTADFITSVVGEQIPQFGAQVVGSLIGFGAARRLGASAATAATAGAAAPSFVQNFGVNMLEQKEAGVYEPGVAVGAAGLQAALDTVLFSTIAQRLGGKVNPAQLRKGKAKLAADIIKGAGIEGVTEGLQEGVSVLARTAVDPNYPDRRDEIMSRILNAVVGGGILGAGFGGASSFFTPSGQPQESGVPGDTTLVQPPTPPVPVAIAPQVPPSEEERPLPEITPEDRITTPIEITRGGAQTFQQITLPDVYVPPPRPPIEIPPAPNRALRTTGEILQDADTISQAFGVPTPERTRVRIPTPVVLGETPAPISPDVRKGIAEMKKLEGVLLTSEDIRALRGEKAPTLEVVEGGRQPRARGGPAAEAKAQSFITERVDEAASTVLQGLVTAKALSSGSATNIRRMIKNRMSEVYAQDADTRGGQFDSVLRDIVSNTPLRRDAAQFVADVHAEIARQPEKNQLPAGASDFVVTDKPFPQVPRTAAPLRVAPVEGEPQLPLFGTDDRAAQAVTRQVALKTGKPVEQVAAEQLSLFSKSAMNFDPATVAANHNKFGGSTTDPISGVELAGSKGFAVSGLPGRELIISGDLTPEQVAEYAHANADALSKAGAVLGTWKNKDTGLTHLDISVVSQTLEEAIQVGLDTNQIAVWDMRLGVDIPLGHPVLNLAQVYNSQVGLPPRQRLGFIDVDASLATELAYAYANAKDASGDPEVQSAYAAMNVEVKAQFDLASQTIKIEKWIGAGQPYADSAEMRRDVFDNRHLWVWDGGTPPALMTREQNFMHRAVHDIFGHAGTGFEFSPRGEWNAFRLHAQMFSPPALRAFVSESIAQVAFANYHESNLGKPTTERTFGEQKSIIIPDALWERVVQAPIDAQAEVYYNFQTNLAKLGEDAIAYLNKIIGGRDNFTLVLQMNGTQYAGRYRKGELKSVIELALNAKDVLSTAAHEGYHFLEEEVLSEAERAAVARELSVGTKTYERLLAAARAYDVANKTNISAEIAEDPREARAYGFEFYRRGQLEAKGTLARAYEKLKALLNRIVSYLTGKPFASMTDIFDAIERGDYSTKRALKVRNSNIAEDEWTGAVEPDVLPGQDLLVLHKDRVASKAKGRPWWVENAADVKRMRAELKTLAMEGQRGRTWHRRSAEAALVFARGDVAAAEKVAALFANYSPQQEVGFDARAAFIAILKHSQGLPITGTGARYPKAMDARAQLILDGKADISGIKRESFFWNMMKYINPGKYPEATQRATIDMWMAYAFGHDDPAVSDPQYLYGDAEVKRLARELGWGVDEVQAAVWVAIKARMDPEYVRERARRFAETRGWMEDTVDFKGDAKRAVKKEHRREYLATWRSIGMERATDGVLSAEIDRANYAYDNALRDLATGKINLGGTQARLTPEHYDPIMGPALREAERLGVPLGTDWRKPAPLKNNTLDLFSRAAMIDLEDKLRRGEFDKIAAMRAMQELTVIAQPAESKVAKLMGIGAEAKYKTGDVLGAFSRTYDTWLASGEYRATKSIGYKNVHNVLTYFEQRKKRLISDAVDSRLSRWRTGASADLDAVSKVMLDRTMKGYELDSDDHIKAMRGLSEEQRAMFKQATAMIAFELDAEFTADVSTYSRLLGRESPEFAEWFETRGQQVEELKRTGYFPERRYGDHAVNMFVVTPEGKKITIGFETYDTASQAKLRINGTARAKGLKSTLEGFPAVGIEYAYKYKPELDGSVSFQRVMELLDANGVEVTQAEKERLAKALIAADSTRRNRIFRRENVPGASTDGLRVLSEFAVANSAKIAYAEFGDAIQKARKGNDTKVSFDQAGVPRIAIDETTNLWAHDNVADSGFYRTLADQKVNHVLQPDNNRLTAGLRALASLQFLGGSIAAAGVQLTSIPMNTVPFLTQYTSYADASAKTYGAFSTVVAKNGRVFLQSEPSKILADLQALDVAMPGIDEVPGLRQALIVAFQDGTTMDTDIYEIMGLARGQILSLPRGVQKAADLWMLPFRKAEQVNRWTTFIAAYKIGQKKGITGRPLYEFARKTVDSTQFRYDIVNRPTLANTPIGSLIMTFKTYPIYMSELILNLAKHNRKAAVVMLGSLWFFAGLEGLPFFEDAEDLVDTIAQRIFGSPFNSQRFLRNMISDASEVVPFVPNSDILLRGTFNFLSDANVAGRVGLGNLLPGTRMFAADADYKRTAEEIAGPALSAVTGWKNFVGTWNKGDLELALRNAPFLAVQNLAKGYTAFSEGFYTDGRGQKLVDAGPYGAFLQGVGFSPESVRQAYETSMIDRRTTAYYSEYKNELIRQMVQFVRDGDREGVQEVVELTRRWNAIHPDMPILPSSASVRRAVNLAGMSLNERTLAMLPKQLRYSSATFEASE